MTKLDIGYIPCHPKIVSAMLAMAEVTKSDLLYDLGCGDGRILITAAQKYGTRGVGIDLDPKRIEEANFNSKRAGVSDRVTFSQQNLFETDLRNATVVTLYLLPHLNLKLRSRLFEQLSRGTRIISRDFDLGDWQPQKIWHLEADLEQVTLYYWQILTNIID